MEELKTPPSPVSPSSTLRTVAIQLLALVGSQFILFVFLKLLIYFSVLQSRIPEDIVFKSEAERLEIQQELAQDFQKDLEERPQIFTEQFFHLLFEEKPGLLFWNSLFWGLSFLPLGYWLFRKKLGWQISLFEEKWQGRDIYLGFLMGIGLFFFVSLSTALLLKLGFPPKNNIFQSKLLLSLHDNSNLFVWSLFTIGLMTGLMEELYFRGYFLKTFAGWNQPQLGLWTSSIIFGMVHYSPESSWYIPILLTVVGYGFGHLYLKTGSLFASVSAHTTYNSIGILLAYLFGDQIPQ